MDKDTLDSWETVAKICAVVIALFSFGVTAYQTWKNTKVNRAKFWLDLREMFSEHDEVHLKLRGGQWSEPEGFTITEQSLERMKTDGVSDLVLEQLKPLEDTHYEEKERFEDAVKSVIGDKQADLSSARKNASSGPLSPEEWAKVEAYMGLFEHCKGMLDQRLLDWKTFETIYGYRVGNLLANPVIVRAKLIRKSESWRAFIELARRLGMQSSIVEIAREWLNDDEGKDWLSTKDGEAWLRSKEGKIWLSTKEKKPQLLSESLESS
jgi:hypothetical protein